jgi:hypothetical protein
MAGYRRPQAISSAAMPETALVSCASASEQWSKIGARYRIIAQTKRRCTNRIFCNAIIQYPA